MLKDKNLPREKKSIRIHPRTLIQLKKISVRTGFTFSELIREAIEQYVLKYKDVLRVIHRKSRDKLDEKRE